ncbi:Sterol 3-beta-glucosyltransferase UGT80A2 [Linum perenne]
MEELYLLDSFKRDSIWIEEALAATVDATPSNSSVCEHQSIQTVPEGWENPEKQDSSTLLQQPQDDKLETSDAMETELFGEKFSINNKVKLFKRLSTIKEDGTIQFEVPGNIEPSSLELRSFNYSEAPDDESVDTDDMRDIPPLQIVMLIVGTRGDVQPFIAIGIRLQNKGIVPSERSEILLQRKQIREIIFSLYAACKDPDPETKVRFKAEAIIANPPSYGNEVFQFIRATSEFPHPLTRVKQPAAYRLSYHVVDTLLWLGAQGMINECRKKHLKLRPVTYLSGSDSSRMELPFGYIWSPHLVPKPKDWGPKKDVVGFCFLDLAKKYEPPTALLDWLGNGDAPIYFGFGSLPLQEPEKMTELIIKALELTGQRGVLNEGWGKLGNVLKPKKFVYSLDSCPHDWLFLRCKAVVHHGGAGTTAAGLKAACPTTIVPFFGDQFFWGDQVHARGVGPEPIPFEDFTTEKLVYAIKYMLDPKVKLRAVELAKAMEKEDGVTGAVKAFYKHFPATKLASVPPSELRDSETNESSHSRFSIFNIF